MSKYTGKSPSSFHFKTILYEKKEWLATITLNRPEVHNAINFQMLKELSIAFEDVTWDNAIAVLVITGAGKKAFCTGADIKEWNEDFVAHPNDFYKWMGVFLETFERLRNIGKPTIAKLNGIVVGGGNELQMSCDLAVAADDIYFKHVGTSRGSVPSAGATQWLPLIIGERRARQMILLGDDVSAKQAKEWGLVNEVVPRKNLDKSVATMAEKLYNKLPECTRYAKEQLNFWKNFSWSLTVGHLRDWLTVHTSAPEIIEGIKAFNEKRPIDYAKLRNETIKPAKRK
ncbi:MAG: enoyl-CoA hydratase/isomerase family protein [Ignavibacteriales bacterium]|nr:enoyl-CoA hydratase/isomerase family protein [Ignavibacteriales bacterium]